LQVGDSKASPMRSNCGSRQAITPKGSARFRLAGAYYRQWLPQFLS